MFRQDNTNYQYSEKELEQMNQELQTLLIDNNVNEDDENLIAFFAEKVLNNH